jgi:ketosteroid isomerase-like protein
MEDQSAKEVRGVITQFLKAVQKCDINALAKIIAHDNNIVFYGSQAGDKQVGWDAVKASFEEQFAETSTIQNEVLDSKVSVVGDLAWAAYDLRYSEAGSPGAGSFESRWTCVLHRYADGWKYVHMHHSRGR